MTADEARKLTKGSMDHKGFIFKARLAWTCGLLNKKIEEAAELGETEVTMSGVGRKFARRYFSILAQTYEDEGYFVCYADNTAISNAFTISWADFSKLSWSKLRQWFIKSPYNGINYTYHTEAFDKYWMEKEGKA